MANHRAADAAALLLITSLLVAVALSGADARPTVLPDKFSSAVLGGGNQDAHGRGLADPAVSAVVNPDCDDEEDNHSSHKHHHKQPKQHKHHGDDNEDEYPDHKYHRDDDDDEDDYPDYPEANSVEQELCSECEEPKMPSPPPPCDTCDEPKEPELKCNKVHTVRDGETCYSMGQCAGLGQDDLLRFNPNVCCDNLFVGQWVCLDATCDAE